VIGVMPPQFNFPPKVPITSSVPSRRAEFLISLGLAFNANERDWNMLGIIGRLKGDIDLAQARADLATIARGLAQQYPDQDQQIQVNVEPLLDQVVGDVRPTL
jgi:hypothetical protein